MKPPLELRRLLLHRTVWIALGSLLLALPGLWMQARSDIRSESLGAEETAAIFAHLLDLQNSRGPDLEARLVALNRPGVLGPLRHLRLEVTDEAGTVLTAPPADEHPLAERFFGTKETDEGRHTSWITSGDGRRLRVTVSSSPASEAAEALQTLLDLLLWCVGYTVLLVAGITLVMHQAFAPLRSIVEKISNCMSQNYTTRLPTLSVKEMDVIGQAVNHLADTLEKTEASRRALSLKMVSVQEEERTRLVQELHDEFGQSLTAMRASAAYLVKANAQQPVAQAAAQELADQCQQLHGGLRNLLHRLRPLGNSDAQEPVPLADLLDRLLASWRKLPGQETSYTLHYAVDGAIASSLALALYRMTQEALTNAFRHADAKQVSIHLVLEDDQLCWCVSDDGVGIPLPEEALQRGNGLAGLRERVWSHGGNLQMGAGKGERGLTISARFRHRPSTSPALEDPS
ncbi:MAG: hypothetical protein EKK46_08070 [Rhodocyclaceae bacterium]|nr:MAG: hypothetical protein EKK46_08070 [Rhodocyclaceae bacterium]